MFEKLFIKHTHYLGYQLTHSEQNNHGWIGGNAPEWFADKEHLLTDENGNVYGFFLSMLLPISEHMVSIFIPEQFSVYADAKHPCNIKTFVHPNSRESEVPLHPLMPEKPAPIQKTTGMNNSKPVINKTYIAPFVEYPITQSRPFDDFIKFGGNPDWIVRNREEYYANTLLERGYSFIMQVNEQQYPSDVIHGNDPFCYGTLYLYAQVQDSVLADLTAAFWQN